MSQLAEKVMNRFRLDGKTAVVTGGAGNIGSHGAAAFAEAGADIAICRSASTEQKLLLKI